MARLLLVVAGVRLSLAACLLPPFGPLGYVGVPGTVTCVSQGSLQVGQACSVDCEPNSTAIGGPETRLFACATNNVLASPTLVCQPSCTVPAFGTGIIGSPNPNAYPCSPGSLCRSCTCDLACDASRNFSMASGLATYTCTSGGLLRGGTLKCFPCLLPSDFNISHLDQSNAAGLACVPGAGLPNSTSCNLACDSRYVLTGTNQYHCGASGVLSTPSMTCEPQVCAIPPVLNPYSAGNCTSSLAPGESCFVECDSRHTAVSGSGEYRCESLNATPPTLVCGPKNCTATLPPTATYTYDSSLPNACAPGLEIESGTSCNIACELGFKAVDGEAKLTCDAGEIDSTLVCQAAGCAFFGVLPVGHTSMTCALGGIGNATLAHGASCMVGCAVGYTGTPQTYSCSFGLLSTPAPFCHPNTCTLPLFETGFVENPDGPNNSSCVSEGTLASSSSCDVMCDSGFTASSGSLSYSCYLGVLTATPTAQCVPEGGCISPSLACLQSQTCTAANPACLGVTPLVDGTTCELTCVSTFTRNDSAVNTYECINGTLTEAEETCTPTSCVVDLDSLGILGTGIVGCVDEDILAHNESCTLGCEDPLQVVVPSQAASTIHCLYGAITVSSPINNQFCRVAPCVLPTVLPVGFTFFPNNTGCSPGGTLENYPSTSSCNLRCDQGYVGTPTYQCTESGLGLLGSCVVRTCDYYVSDLTGVIAGNSTECDELACELFLGSHSLTNGTCCDYACEEGYHVVSESNLRLNCPTIPTNCGNFSECSTTPAHTEEPLCRANTCMLPDDFLPANAVGVGAHPCTAGMALAGDGINSTCDIDCLPGFDASGSGSYSCLLGDITNATLVCTPQACEVPPLLYGQEGAEGGFHNVTCVEGLPLQSGEACDVSCPENFTEVTGTKSISCLKGNISAATVICLAEGDCLFPSSFLSGYIPTGVVPCALGWGSILSNGESCSVSCASGYDANHTDSPLYSCVDGVLTPPDLTCTPQTCDVQLAAPMVPSSLANACLEEDVLQSGENCTVACEEGFAPATIVYSCVRGDLTVTGACVEASCPLPTLPNTLPTVVNGCNNSASLASGQQCNVQCIEGYAAEESTLEFSCERGNLTIPEGVCLPLPCTKNFAANEVADNRTGIPCGGTLQSGEECESRCDDGFLQTTYRFQCNRGNLTSLGPYEPCVPLGCVIPNYPGANIVSASVSDCFPGDILASGSSCSWRCASTAFYNMLGSNTFTCNQGVLIATAVGMTCTPFACTLLPFPEDMIGVAAGAIPACNTSSLLGHGQSCNVGCASLTRSSGSTVFSCSAGVLTAPTAICYDSATHCALNFASPMIGQSQGGMFACGSQLARGESCRVGCASGYVPNGGTQIYTCSSGGVLTSPSLVCLGSSCAIPDLSAQAVISPHCTASPLVSASAGCSYGYVAINGTRAEDGVIDERGGGEVVLSCAQCAGLCDSLRSCASYQCSPTVKECRLFQQSTPSGLPSSDIVFCSKTEAKCSFGYHPVVGDVLGAGSISIYGGDQNVLQCSVCADYCTSLTSCLSYECDYVLRQCNLNTIATPNGPALANVAFCVKDVVPNTQLAVGTIASNSSCQAQCHPSYQVATYPMNPSTQFSCKGGRLTQPSLRCVPRPCVYPQQFPSNYHTPTFGPTNRCTLGGVVAVGSTCLVECLPYFYPVAGTGVVTCFLGPNLTTPSLVCAPYRCSRPTTTPTGYVDTGCATNSSSAECNVTCAHGYTANGTIKALCPTDGGIFEYSGCVPLPQCTLPTSTPGYSVTCTGASPYLASACTASCSANFGGAADVSCSENGTALTFAGCSSCTCAQGSGRSGSCSSSCVACPPQTVNNGSQVNCTACPAGTCPNQNRSKCVTCLVDALEEDDGVSGGGIAAAVLVPLILIVGGVAVFMKREKIMEILKKRPSMKKTTANIETEMTNVEKGETNDEKEMA